MSQVISRPILRTELKGEVVIRLNALEACMLDNAVRSRAANPKIEQIARRFCAAISDELKFQLLSLYDEID